MFLRLRDYSLAKLKNALTILALLICACSVSGSGTDELHIGVRLTTGEQSKDSSSNTTTITVERDAIVWEETSSRDRRMGTPPLRKEFKLSPADKGNLLKLIKSNNLLVTDSIELPRAAPNSYFKISVALTLGEEKGAIHISGPRTAVKVKEEKLYQNTLTLVKELYRIMNSQDKGVLFEELILGTIR
jgi:hypothetical protein